MSDTVRRTSTPAGDPAWLVSDYDLVKQLLADPRLGRSHPCPEQASRYSESVIFGRPQRSAPTEAAEHARMRRLLGPWFSARRMERLRPRVQEIIDGLLDDVVARGAPVDLHEVVSFPLPALVICEILGVPYADREDFRRWSDEAADMTDQQRSFAGLGALWQYMTGLVAAKLDEPGDDVLSALIEAHRSDPDGFGLDAVAQLGAALLFAGHETTVAAIDTAVVLLGTIHDSATSYGPTRHRCRQRWRRSCAPHFPGRRHRWTAGAATGWPVGPAPTSRSPGSPSPPATWSCSDCSRPTTPPSWLVTGPGSTSPAIPTRS